MYHELGGDHYDRRNPERTAKRLTQRLERMGVLVDPGVGCKARFSIQIAATSQFFDQGSFQEFVSNRILILIGQSVPNPW